MRYFKIITDDDWFIIVENDMFRCKKMLNDKIKNVEFFGEWRHIRNERNKFNEYTPKAYDEWLKQNLN